MGDYPDWTTLFRLIGSDIMMPVDMQASYIMMPVDIQAQYLTLDIDITAQSIGDITIDVTAQHVGIYLQPDWNIFEGNAKSVGLAGINVSVGNSQDNDYVVPSGKTLWVTNAGCRAAGHNAADRDLNQMISFAVGAIGTGGNGGCQLIITSPLKFNEGETCTIAYTNRSNHSIDVYAFWRGYEI